MPDDSSSSDPPSSLTDIYENDPYRKRRGANHNKITWQVPSKSTPHSYLPYSDCSFQQQQQQQQKPLSSTARTDSLASNGFHSEHEQGLSSSMSTQRQDKDTIRQDSLLTTITTTARTSSTLVAGHPFLHSATTTLSLSEELRKQKYQDTKSCWRWPLLLFYPCCGRQGQRKPSLRWICLMVFFLLLGVGGILLFICFPRLPIVTMAQTADTYGQELADWGPPQNPFYRTTWQLNLTLDNRPNFIPLHITQMDLVLRLHPALNLTHSLSNSVPNATFTDDNTNVTLAANQSHSIIRPPPANLQQTLTNDTIVPFAWSTLPSMTLNTDGKHQVVNAIFHIDYVAPTSNLTDPTFAQLYKCGPHIITDPPALNVSLHMTFHILDYLWAPTLTVYPSEGNGLICPAN